MTIILASGCDEHYYPKAKAYIESMSQYSNVENRYYCLDFDPPEQFPNISYRRLDFSKFVCPAKNKCFQDGNFLAQDAYKDDDIIIFTDSDIVLQRSFTRKELNQFARLKYREIMVAPNISMGTIPAKEDNLLNEFINLEPTVKVADLEDALMAIGCYGDLRKMKCWNTGVVICQARTYRRLFAMYCEIYPTAVKAVNHYASEQWVLSYLINKHFYAVAMPRTLHTHGLYGLPEGLSSQLLYRGTPILFRHKINLAPIDTSRIKYPFELINATPPTVCVDGDWDSEGLWAHCSPLVELRYPLADITACLKDASVWAIMGDRCAHEIDINCPGKLGRAAFSELFFVLANNPTGRDIYNKYRNGETLTNILSVLDMRQCGYLPPDLMKVCVSPDETPVICWGREV